MTQPSNLSPAEVNQLHRNADRDNSKESLHHTLGILPYQAASGAHTHDGRDSKILNPVSVAPHSHSAVSIDNTPSGALISTNVQSSLEELEGEMVSHTHGFQTATQTNSTAVGGVSATNVQAAIQELDAEKSNTTHTHATLVTPTNVVGSRGGNAALASLLTALAGKGIITDSTTA